MPSSLFLTPKDSTQQGCNSLLKSGGVVVVTVTCQSWCPGRGTNIWTLFVTFSLQLHST